MTAVPSTVDDDAHDDAPHGPPADTDPTPGPQPLTPAPRDVPGGGPPRAGKVLDLDGVVRGELPALLRYAAALTGDPELAADIVQEVLARAHHRWNRIGQLERPDLYLRRMVTNEHLSWRRRWHVRFIHPTAADTIAERATPLADHAAGVADRDALTRSLAGLSARQRTVLVLRYFEDRDDDEIAAVLGTSTATVRSHASQALAKLRRTSGPNSVKEQP